MDENRREFIGGLAGAITGLAVAEEAANEPDLKPGDEISADVLGATLTSYLKAGITLSNDASYDNQLHVLDVYVNPDSDLRKLLDRPENRNGCLDGMSELVVRIRMVPTQLLKDWADYQKLEQERKDKTGENSGERFYPYSQSDSSVIEPTKDLFPAKPVNVVTY